MKYLALIFAVAISGCIPLAAIPPLLVSGGVMMQEVGAKVETLGKKVAR